MTADWLWISYVIGFVMAGWILPAIGGWLDKRADWQDRAHKLVAIAMDAHWVPAEPKKGILQRIADFFRGGDSNAL